MDIKVNLESLTDLENVKIDAIKFQKMLFLFNAIEQGWSVKKEETLLSSQKVMKVKKKC